MPSRPPKYADLGTLLYRARRAKRWSQVELGMEAGGLSDSFISRLEAGHARPSPETLRLLAQKLNIDPNELAAAAGYIPPQGGEVTIAVSSEKAGPVRRLIERYTPDQLTALDEVAARLLGLGVEHRVPDSTSHEAEAERPDDNGGATDEGDSDQGHRRRM